jgi:hypothetical protein
MPAVQTTFSETMRPALEGMIADTTPQTILSRVVEGTGGIGFGKVALKGTGDLQVRAAPGGVYQGITVADLTIQHIAPPAGGPDFYPEKDVCNIIVQGSIWVLASVAVTAGEPAYFVPATGVITNVSTANTAIPNARFESSAGIGALTKLRLL